MKQYRQSRNVMDSMDSNMSAESIDCVDSTDLFHSVVLASAQTGRKKVITFLRSNCTEKIIHVHNRKFILDGSNILCPNQK